MKAFFNFSKGEQRGIIVLLLTIAALIVLNFLKIRPSSKPAPASEVVAWEQDVIEYEQQRKILAAQYDSIRAAQKADREARYKNFYAYSFPDENPKRQLPEYFFFDPNTVTISELTKLGFSQKQAEVIDRYRKRGTIFKEKADFAKVFVVSEELYEHLEPWIIIAETNDDSTTTKSIAATAATPFILLELNSCDTAQLRQLKGIGAVLSKKIVDHRTKLGGYYSIDQISDINGIQQEVMADILQHLTVDATSVKKIDLNKATFKQLLQHPYFEYHIVKNIFDFKDKNGMFQSVEQLKEIPLMYEDLYNKIQPYLTVK